MIFGIENLLFPFRVKRYLHDMKNSVFIITVLLASIIHGKYFMCFRVLVSSYLLLVILMTSKTTISSKMAATSGTKVTLCFLRNDVNV